MTQHAMVFKKTGISKTFFLLSILVMFFWIVSSVTNVYHFTISGIIFEMLWFPVLAMTIILPVMSFIYWHKEKYNFRSLYLYSISLVIGGVIAAKFLR
jgi:hypothetical protein